MKAFYLLFFILAGVLVAALFTWRVTQPHPKVVVHATTVTQTQTQPAQTVTTTQTETQTVAAKQIVKEVPQVSQKAAWTYRSNGFTYVAGKSGGAYLVTAGSPGQGNYDEVFHLPFNGRTLWCIRGVTNSDSPDSWNCDWDGYHHDAKGAYVK